MTIKQLIKHLSKYDENTIVACYSNEGECDFNIEKVQKTKVKKHGLGFYCASDSRFDSEYFDNVPPIGTEVIVLSGDSR